ncbi:MAG: adenylyltransferase/cytidyltransferase family protein [bacterium]|nr:adenylyltransferase/cytidyltransferase family protein [bacterium]
MKKVVIFGTFDVFHPGHASFLKQAKKLGDSLLVVVARDFHVQRVKNKLPLNSEKSRAQKIRRFKLADQVILGSKTHNFYRTLRSHKIDILALGYDQKPTVAELKRDLRRHRLGEVKIVRLRGLKPEIYKTSKLQKES